MAIKLKKKGMIFTVVSILLVGVLIAQVAMTSKTSYKQKSFVAQSRVLTMNDFISSVEDDIIRSIYIAGFRGILVLQKHVAYNASFINNLQSTFNEILINGSINSTSQDLMIDASINDWTSRISDEALKLNINMNFISNQVTIEHVTPWTVKIDLNITFNVSDTNNLASWYFTDIYSKNITIISFEDPLYTVKSFDRVTNIIHQTLNYSFVDPITNDTTILYNHLNNSYYIESNSSPSFLQRFEGNLSSSEFGITSLVNLEDFSLQSIPIFNKSVIDYHYFNDIYDESSDKCNFIGMPSWFRINTSELDDYNLTGKGVNC